MTNRQMQNTYDEIEYYITCKKIKFPNDNGSGEHRPSVYEYVEYAIANDDGFYAWMFDDDEIESKYDLSREQRIDLADFVKFCDRTDNPREKVITEHGEDIDEVEYYSNCFSYAYKGKGYNITGDFYIDNDGYLHHWHDDDGEEFEIKYLLHEDW